MIQVFWCGVKSSIQSTLAKLMSLCFLLNNESICKSTFQNCFITQIIYIQQGIIKYRYHKKEKKFPQPQENHCKHPSNLLSSNVSWKHIQFSLKSDLINIFFHFYFILCMHMFNNYPFKKSQATRKLPYLDACRIHRYQLA